MPQMEYLTTLGPDEIEFVLHVTYHHSPGFPGDRIDPPYDPEIQVEKVEIEVSRWVTKPNGTSWPTQNFDGKQSFINKAGKREKEVTYIDVTLSDSIAAEMDSDRARDAMHEDWRTHGDGPDPDDAYDAARDRKLIA